MDNKKRFLATAIGSLPHTDPKEATEFILKNFKEVPFWPQLPRLSFFENMYVQFSDGLPGLVVDETKKKIYINRTDKLIDQIECVYSNYLEDDPELFAIKEKYLAGFYEFIFLLKKDKPKELKFIKGQITGPVSFGLTITDDKKIPIFYDDELRQVLAKILCMKARWQIKRLKQLHSEVIIFIDEPYLVSIGSSYVNISMDEAIGRLNELINSIHLEGALCGIHCCGNTDWQFLLQRDIDILSFDAYNFSGSILLYPKELEQFLQKNGMIAWGLVPSSKIVEDVSVDSLIEKFNEIKESLKVKGIDIDKLSNLFFITPSCGCGTLTLEQANRAMDLTKEVAEILNK